MSTATTHKLTGKSQVNDLNVYLAVFDAFAADKSDVVAETGLNKAQVTKSLKRLQERGLVDTYDVNAEAQGSFRRGEYKELTWQCNETYDSITRTEAIARFHGESPEPALSGITDAQPFGDEVDEPKSKSPSKAQPGLTNSQRRTLLRLTAGRIMAEGLTKLSRKPLEYFVEVGYADREGKTASDERFVITDAGQARAKTIDAKKYRS